MGKGFEVIGANTVNKDYYERLLKEKMKMESVYTKTVSRKSKEKKRSIGWKNYNIVTGKQIGRASCRERV